MPLGDGERVIGRAIVPHDDFEPFVRLGSDAAKRFVDRRAGVESRNDYTDQVRTGTH